MILFTHPKAPQGPQKFLDAVQFIDRAPGNSVYAVAAMEDAMVLLTMIAQSNPEILEAVMGDYRDYPGAAERFPACILASAALSVAREEERVRAARIAAARAEREAAV